MLRILPLLLILWTLPLIAQQDFDVDQSVKISATVTDAPPRITVNWIQDPRAVSYDLYRRRYGAPSWGDKIASYPAEVIQYVDDDIASGQLYEYKVVKYTETVEGFGYVLSGIALPPVHQSGRLLIVLATNSAGGVAGVLPDYQKVLDDSGWPNRTVTVSPTASAEEVKDAILTAHADFSATAVLLLGNVPLALSGDINPDAHDDHKGAWPADGYYGDLDDVWTDETVNNTSAATSVNHNVPGDGKWDQSFFPGDIELAVGRVDFSNLTVFPETEEELLHFYLAKNVAYRTGTTPIPQRAAIRNTNPWTGALGQNGIRNFSPLVSPENITYGIWRDVFEEPYLWYYGAGSDAVRNGLSSAYADSDFQAVFTLWFSSYVGDYGLTDNYMKAVLGSGNALTAGWAGAPHWHLHSMGMGFPIGHGLVATQNNDTIYTADFFPRGVHVNLLGDPTLTSFIVPAPQALIANQVGEDVSLSWLAAGQETDRQYIYRRVRGAEAYQLLDSTDAITTSYLDQTALIGETYDYLIRAAMLTTSPSGTFWNLSTGVTAQIQLSTSLQSPIRPPVVNLYPNPTAGRLVITSSEIVRQVSICSVTGVTLRSIPANTQQVAVNLSALPVGTYVVRITQAGGQSAHRVVVVR